MYCQIGKVKINSHILPITLVQLIQTFAMKTNINTYFNYLLIGIIIFYIPQTFGQSSAENDVVRLVGALLHDTPIEEDLQELCDGIGGRVTGSEANKQSVEWGLKKFQEAGVNAKKEAFEMPGLWLENSTTGKISGDISFSPKMVARCFSPATPKGGLEAELIDGGMGTAEDFKRLGSQVKGKYVLVETKELVDVAGLFAEYADNEKIEALAVKAEVAGLIYMSSRPRRLLFTYIASTGFENKLTMATMGREDAQRCMRILRNGGKLRLNLNLDLQIGGSYTTHNVIAEIKGSEKPDEIIIIGAHLDSWGLGTGANDNGCNVGMMIDIARQMQKLGIQPKRTIRFALWNGEEQGYYGSWAYNRAHQRELDKHIMAMSVDIGSGKVTGFYTNGREELMEVVDQNLWAVKGLGPFTHVNLPVVGTDNFDFMLEGVANLIAVHQSANYGPHYHAESDTYDKILFPSLKVNSAIIAAFTLSFANMENVPYKRHTRDDIKEIMANSDLEAQMRMMGVWKAWEQMKRGRK